MNNAFKGARYKGYLAGIAGKTEADCPYADKRGGQHQHVVTFSRAFQKYWREGLEEGRQKRGNVTTSADDAPPALKELL
jgi:ribosome modulation factor